MEIITSLIAGLGVFSGVFLAIISPEELRDGKKYFIFLRNILILAIIALLIISFYTKTQLNILLAALIFLVGLPMGTLSAQKQIKKKWYKLLIRATPLYLLIVIISSFLL